MQTASKSLVASRLSAIPPLDDGSFEDDGSSDSIQFTEDGEIDWDSFPGGRPTGLAEPIDPLEGFRDQCP